MVRIKTWLLMALVMMGGGGASHAAETRPNGERAPRAEATDHVAWAAARASAATPRAEPVLRLTDADVAVADRSLIDEQVGALARRSGAMATRAKAEVDSPAYAADWLAWSEAATNLRGLAAWDADADEAALGVPPPPPTRDALESHLVIERERALKDEMLRTEVERRDFLAAREHRAERRAAEERRAQARAELAAGVATPEWHRIAFYNQQTGFRFERLIEFRLRTGHPEPLRGLPDWNAGPARAGDLFD